MVAKCTQNELLSQTLSWTELGEMDDQKKQLFSDYKKMLVLILLV